MCTELLQTLVTDYNYAHLIHYELGHKSVKLTLLDISFQVSLERSMSDSMVTKIVSEDFEINI